MCAVADRLAGLRALFEPSLDTIYLDAATYGLPPRPTVEAMHQAVTDWQAGSAVWVQAWDRSGEVSRSAFAELIGVLPETIALLPSVSVGVGTIAASLHPGDEVVVPDDEFTSVIYPLLVAAREHGVTVRPVPLDDLAQSLEKTTSMVAFSLVQSHSGRTANLRLIADAASAVGAKVLVDATHAIPFVPIDVPVDYVVCAAYKHLLCPRGVAFMYVDRQRWPDVPPLLANWRSAREPYGHYYGGPLDLSPTAARFDVSLAWFSWVGAAASLQLLADWRRQRLLEDVPEMARHLARQLDVPEPLGSVLCVPVEDAEAARTDLAVAGVKASVRAGSVRLSPHVYNTVEEMDLAASALARYVKQPARL
jgi:selenocysteine lyase/cysteine desulfurase